VRFRTTFTQPPNTTDPFEELEHFSIPKDLEALANFLYKNLPIQLNRLATIHSEANRELKANYSVQDLSDTLKQMVANGKIEEKKSPFGLLYQKK